MFWCGNEWRRNIVYCIPPSNQNRQTRSKPLKMSMPQLQFNVKISCFAIKKHNKAIAYQTEIIKSKSHKSRGQLWLNSTQLQFKIQTFLNLKAFSTSIPYKKQTLCHSATGMIKLKRTMSRSEIPSVASVLAKERWRAEKIKAIGRNREEATQVAAIAVSSHYRRSWKSFQAGFRCLEEHARAVKTQWKGTTRRWRRRRGWSSRWFWDRDLLS